MGLKTLIAVAILLTTDRADGQDSEVSRLAAQIATHYEDQTRAGGLKFETTIQGSTPIERMRLTGAGLLAIGTTTPEAMLHVSGDVLIQSLNVTSNVTISGHARIRDATISSNLRVGSGSGVNTHLTGDVHVTGQLDAGRLHAQTIQLQQAYVGSGIDSSPYGFKLVSNSHVGAAELLPGQQGQSGKFTPGGTGLQVRTGMHESSVKQSLFVDNQGRLAVGHDINSNNPWSPESTLHVKGNAKISGSLDVGSIGHVARMSAGILINQNLTDTMRNLTATTQRVRELEKNLTDTREEFYQKLETLTARFELMQAGLASAQTRIDNLTSALSTANSAIEALQENATAIQDSLDTQVSTVVNSDALGVQVSALVNGNCKLWFAHSDGRISLPADGKYVTGAHDKFSAGWVKGKFGANGADQNVDNVNCKIENQWGQDSVNCENGWLGLDMANGFDHNDKLYFKLVCDEE